MDHEGIYARLIRIESTQIEGLQRLIAVETEVQVVQVETKRLNATLYGNGQPGIIEKFNVRCNELEKSVIRIVTAAAVVWSLLIGGQLVITHFTK